MRSQPLIAASSSQLLTHNLDLYVRSTLAWHQRLVSATTFIRSFREVAEHLSQHPEPTLITKKNGRFIVVMDGEFFEGLLSALHRVEDTLHRTENIPPYAFKT
jgi:hypothetical protein